MDVGVWWSPVDMPPKRWNPREQLRRIGVGIDRWFSEEQGRWLSVSDVPLAETVTLYRPVGQRELELIRDSGWTGFPPRLPTQPIFYPVLNQDYAIQIARDWNTRDPASGYVGYVTRFCVAKSFIERYPVQTVGNNTHQEYWIPAEDLDALNQAIVGQIEVIAEYLPNET
ncbi:MAG TPA: hypothetical protein VNT26_13885 [Candidatus Sulfotelmatobacter sp.]|nr:hypothetical protein [Candidatus Sulfotelmatobacter sp.]